MTESNELLVSLAVALDHAANGIAALRLALTTKAGMTNEAIWERVNS